MKIKGPANAEPFSLKLNEPWDLDLWWWGKIVVRLGGVVVDAQGDLVADRPIIAVYLRS